MSLKADDWTTRAQSLASAPENSAFVAANAGSGKTFVLARRVTRLLLEGVEPSRILCLTFTKAAAANMSNRVLADLARFVAMDRTSLEQELRAVTGRDIIEDSLIAHARRIFARALETPGGLKIQTIHAFCDALLHQFPFEAGVAASFSVLSDEVKDRMVEHARRRVLAAGNVDPDSRLGRAIQHLAEIKSEDGAEKILDVLFTSARAVRVLLPDDQAWPRVEKRLAEALGPGGDEALTAVEADMLNEPAIAQSEWPTLAEALMASSPNDQRVGRSVLAAIASSEDGKALAWHRVFLTAEGTLRKTIVTGGFKKSSPELATRMDAEFERQSAIQQRHVAARIRANTLAVLAVGRAILELVDQQKVAEGRLDFSDLVHHADELLSGDAGPWVRWKLDHGVDHVLVDEAQDTSPVQWSIVSALVAEFFAGEGARGASRTLFAVGDEKQSIFSFQGAEPKLFAENGRRFGNEARAANHRFEDDRVKLTRSFRSAPAILEAVDAVFARPDAHAGLTSSNEPTAHTAARVEAKGHVEFWELSAGEEADEDVTGWKHPVDTVSALDSRLVLAGRIAAEVRDLIAHQGYSHGDGVSPFQPKDIIILVRTRGVLFEALIRKLTEAGVPVAGADRMILGKHIAVMDLLALADAVLLPDDDLAVATVLKSPLIGHSEEDLYALAQGRTVPLIAAWRTSPRPDFAISYARFEVWRRRAERMRPYEFYASILGADGSRASFISRLGSEAEDAIDAFLARALAFELEATPTLAGFVAAMRASEIAVKREMDQGRNEVRVLTVHNAKGLEAPVVIVADTTSVPTGSMDGQLFEIETNDGEPPLLMMPAGKDLDPEVLKNARETAKTERMDEYRRLLYVALTRAADRLIVAGARRPKPKETGFSEGCWYQLVSEAWRPGATRETDANGNTRFIWRDGRRTAPRQSLASTAPVDAMPSWATLAPPAPPSPPRLSPSRADADVQPRSGDGLGRKHALARGTVLHALFQHLPRLAPQARHRAGVSYVSAAFPAVDAEALTAEALSIIEAPEQAALFAPDALAEVPIVGQLDLHGRQVEVSGQIDRLARDGAKLIIADFKTGSRPDSIPDAYMRQMALYRALLQKIDPGTVIECRLIWTREPAIDVLSSAELDKTLTTLPAQSIIPPSGYRLVENDDASKKDEERTA
jgi:ATP-dependent helicase/nuclease subunit A